MQEHLSPSSDGMIETRYTSTFWKEQYMLKPETPEHCFETKGNQTAGVANKFKRTMYP